MVNLLKLLLVLGPLVFASGATWDSVPSAAWWAGGLVTAAIGFSALASTYSTLTGRFAQKDPDPSFRQRQDCIEIHKTVTQALKDLHEKAEERTTSLRLEVKADIDGIHRRMDGVQRQISDQTRQLAAEIGEQIRAAAGRGPQ